MAKKEVQKKEEGTELIPGIDISADLGAGMEGSDKDSFAIPFLRVIQNTSPQVNEAKPEYNPNAKVGMFYNSVTGELYDGKEGITFLHCAYQRRFLQWQPRELGGEFHGELLPEDVKAMKVNGEVTELDGALLVGNGDVSEKKNDRLSDTRSHFGLIVNDDGTATQVLFPMSSTQVKKSKQLMSILSAKKIKMNGRLVTPPTWMVKIRMTSVLESNDQGSWYGVRVEDDGVIDDGELYAAGKKFHDEIDAGNARVNYAAADTEDDEDDSF